MIESDPVPPVDDDELLARFILNSNEFRSDETVKPKLFLPFSRVVLSVNRHRDCIEEEIWEVGAYVAQTRKCTFYGRSDIAAKACNIAPLKVVAVPIKDKPDQPDNPNHADITGYPATKAEQMSLATKLAAAAGTRKVPPQSNTDA
jgi:hypothetical protein